MEFLEINKNLSEFSKQLTLLQEYITLKFGLDFEEFCRRRVREHTAEEENADSFYGNRDKGTLSASRDDRNADSVNIDANSSRKYANASSISKDSLSNEVSLDPEVIVRIKMEDDLFDETSNPCDDYPDEDKEQEFGFVEVDNIDAFKNYSDTSDFDKDKQNSTGPSGSKRRKMSISDPAEKLGTREELLHKYVSSSKFRKYWEFPSETSYSKVMEIVKAKKGETVKEVTSSVKQKLSKRYKLQIQTGQEFIVCVADGKKLLPQHQFLPVFEASHDQSGHHGRDKTCQKILEEWHYVPVQLISTLVGQCTTCVARRAAMKSHSTA